MNRRTAIATLAAAVPGLAIAGDKPIFIPEKTDTDRPYDLGFSTSSALTFRQEPLRIACRMKPDGWIEFPLDGWCGWRVMLGGESVEITPEELFAALRGGKP